MRNTRQAFDSVWSSVPVDRMRCDLPAAGSSVESLASLAQHFVDRVACAPCVQAHCSPVRAEDSFTQNSDNDNLSWRAPTIGAWFIDSNAFTLEIAGCTDELQGCHPDIYAWVRGLTVWSQTPLPTVTATQGRLIAEQTYSTAPGDDMVTIVVAPVADFEAIRVSTFNPDDYVPFGAGSGAYAFSSADLIPYERAQFEVQVSRRIPWQSKVPGTVDASTEPRTCTVRLTGPPIGDAGAECIVYARSVAIVHTRGSV